MNQIFSFDRYVKYLRLYFASNRKDLFVSAASILGVLILVMVVNPLLTGTYTKKILLLSDYAKTHDMMWDMCSIFFWFTLFVITMMSGVNIYKATAKKSQRYSLFTLPVSALEQVAVFVTIWFFGVYACFFISYFLADLLRVAVCSMVALKGVKVALIPMSELMPHAGLLEIIVNLFALHSLYTLGSSIWPKSPWFRTTVCVAVLTILMAIFGMFGIFTLDFPDVNIRLSINFVAISGIFAVINYAISYIRYRELETINRW